MTRRRKCLSEIQWIPANCQKNALSFPLRKDLVTMTRLGDFFHNRICTQNTVKYIHGWYFADFTEYALSKYLKLAEFYQ